MSQLKRILRFFMRRRGERVEPAIVKINQSAAEADEPRVNPPDEFAEIMRCLFEDHERVRGVAHQVGSKLTH